MNKYQLTIDDIKDIILLIKGDLEEVNVYEIGDALEIDFNGWNLEYISEEA